MKDRHPKYAFRSPNKDFAPGTLIRFVHAPPRWEGEKMGERCPGAKALGKLGVIISGPYDDAHDWGGVFYVHVNGIEVSHWGDFMEKA